MLSQTIEEDYYGIVTVIDYENGKKKISTKTYPDGSTLEKEYDADENWITRVDRDSEGNVEFFQEWEYVNGELVKTIYTDAEGSVCVTEYDDYKNEKKITRYDSEGNVESVAEKEYVDGLVKNGALFN